MPENPFYQNFVKLAVFLHKLGLSKIRPLVSIYYTILGFIRPNGQYLTDLGKFKMYVNPRDNSITPFIIGGGEGYEKDVTNIINDIVKPGMICADVGANVGYFTLLLASIVGPEGRVYAFEPEPTNFAFLERNIALNKFTNVTLIQKAVSDSTGNASLYLDANNLGSHTLSKNNTLMNAGKISVDTITLDEFFSTKNLMPNFLKIDVEGAEGLVFKGANRILSKENVKIVMEYFPHHLKNIGTDPKELLESLENKGFKIRRINVEQDELERYNMLMEK